MIGFLVAIAAGFLTPYAEEPVGRPVAKALRPFFKIEDSEHRLLAFMILSVGAGLVASWTNSHSPFWVAIGLVLGYFATRIVEAARTALDRRKGD